MPRFMNGEPVSLEVNSANISTAAAVVIKDSELKVRTLQAYERLVVDTLEADIASTLATVNVFADLNGNGAVDADELIASFSPTATLFSGGPSGLSLPKGITPSAIANASGQVYITGTGRIVAETPGYNSYGRMPSGKNQG